MVSLLSTAVPRQAMNVHKHDNHTTVESKPQDEAKAKTKTKAKVKVKVFTCI
jgi:hypothetical protein